MGVFIAFIMFNTTLEELVVLSCKSNSGVISKFDFHKFISRQYCLNVVCRRITNTHTLVKVLLTDFLLASGISNSEHQLHQTLNFLTT